MAVHPCFGSVGGLVSLWDSPRFALSREIVQDRFIWLEGTICHLNLNCVILNVYAYIDPAERNQLWNTLYPMISASTSPVLMAGDFNKILTTEERSKGVGYTRGMLAFARWVDQGGFVDISLQGRMFTWSNSRCKSLLDRLFMQTGWVGISGNRHLRALPKHDSDHNPIVFAQDTLNWGPKPFRDLAAWWDFPGF